MVGLGAFLLGVAQIGAAGQIGAAQIGAAQIGAAQIGAAQPPAAYIDTGAGRVALAVTSWCWDARCGAPLGQSSRRVTVAHGAAVRVELKFDPVRASVSVGGAPTRPTAHGRELSWAATRGGGLSVYVKYRRGWVIYTARLALR